MTPKSARLFAEEWIAAWNSHDLERVLSHYTDDFTMSSPKIVALMGDASGVLHGKDAIRVYWAKALVMLPDLHFELERVYLGAGSITIEYRRNGGELAAEVLYFNTAGQVTRGAAHYEAV